MNKGTRWIKRVIALSLVLLLSIESFGAIVSDNDGSAFITKAEFDSLKNNFQSQIDSYNTSIDSKIDGAIAAYLAGIQLSSLIEQKKIYESIFKLPIAMTNNGKYFHRSKYTNIGADFTICRVEGFRSYYYGGTLQSYVNSGKLASSTISSWGASSSDGGYTLWDKWAEQLATINFEWPGSLTWLSGNIKNGKFYATRTFVDANYVLMGTGTQWGSGQVWINFEPYMVFNLLNDGVNLGIEARGGKNYRYIQTMATPSDVTIRYVDTDEFKLPNIGGGLLLKKNNFNNGQRLTDIKQVEKGTSIVDDNAYVTNYGTGVFALDKTSFNNKNTHTNLNELSYSSNSSSWIGYQTAGSSNDKILFECNGLRENLNIVYPNRKVAIDKSEGQPANTYLQTNTWDSCIIPNWAPVKGHNNEDIDNDTHLSERGSLMAKYINIEYTDDNNKTITNTLDQGLLLCIANESGALNLNLTFAKNTESYRINPELFASLPSKGKLMFIANNPRGGIDKWVANKDELLNVKVNNKAADKINVIDYNGNPIKVRVEGIKKGDKIYMAWCADDTTKNYTCHGILNRIDNVSLESE